MRFYNAGQTLIFERSAREYGDRNKFKCSDTLILVATCTRFWFDSGVYFGLKP